jgi:hypothetical protein
MFTGEPADEHEGVAGPTSTPYDIASHEVRSLVDSCLANSWNVATDFPWETRVSPEQLAPDVTHTLLASLPEFERMSHAERTALALKERIYHLSNLLAGEHRAIALTAQVILDAPALDSDILCFASFVLADERNHYLAIHRYLKEKVGAVYAPHPRLVAIMDALTHEGTFEMKLFVAQVALEWTAASLLTSLTINTSELLLRAVMRRVLADEGRHLKFNHWAMKQLSDARRAELAPSLEGLFFEAILATVSSFFAVPVWREWGLRSESCRHHALQELERRGVLRYFARVLPQQLGRSGFRPDGLLSRLEAELVDRLVRDQWTFSPAVASAGGAQ